MNKYLDLLEDMLGNCENNIFQPILGAIGCFIGFVLFIPFMILYPLFRGIYLILRGLYEEMK